MLGWLQKNGNRHHGAVGYNFMSNPQNVPQVWEIIEAANDAEECHVRFTLVTSLGLFHTSHEGPYVHVQLHDSSGECCNQELADIIRAKGKEAMRQAEAREVTTPGTPSPTPTAPPSPDCTAARSSGERI